MDGEPPENNDPEGAPAGQPPPGDPGAPPEGDGQPSHKAKVDKSAGSREGKSPAGGEELGEADDKAEEALDFSEDELSPDLKVKSPKIEKYDSRPIEDHARRNIAYSLIFILFFIVFAIFILLLCKVISVLDIKDFSVILGPIVTLVSAATGFYYGTKSTKKS